MLMTNLLPLQQQKNIRRSLRARLIIVGATAATVVAIVALLALMPSYLAVRYSISASQNSAATSSLASAADRAQILELQSLTTELRPFVASTTPTQAILFALAEKPTGISLDDITYAAGLSDASGQIVVSGAAHTPDLIRVYQEALTKDPHFKSASVPVGALVGTNDGRFSATLTGAF